MHERTSHTCIAHWHRPHSRTHIGQHSVGQTMQISDNYLNDSHLPCHNGHAWQLAVAVSFEVPDDACRRPRRSVAWMVVRTDFNVIACCLLYFTKSISAIRQCRFADVLACSDVAIFWCLMCISSEHYMIHVKSSNSKYMWAAFWPP